MNTDFSNCTGRVKWVVLGAMLSAACLDASAASFDCAKARSKSERLICGDPKLSALDDQLAVLAAAGKKRAASPRAYQRALDAEWLMRQKCADIACVESWYARRIDELSGNQSEPAQTVAKARVAPVSPPPAPAPSPPPTPAVAPAPRRVAVTPELEKPAKPNVSPGGQLQVIGAELGFSIPLTQDEFLERYEASGGQCGAGQRLSGLKAMSRSVVSGCWSGTECRAPAAGLSCRLMQTGYDSAGRLVLFTTTLGSGGANGADGTRDLSKLVERFAEFGGGETSTRDGKKGRVLSSKGSQGQFQFDAEVVTAEGEKQVGTFSLVTK